MELYDRLLSAMGKLLGREDLESQLLLRVMSDMSVETGELLAAIEMAEAMEI
jgi:hypothetical protein